MQDTKVKSIASVDEGWSVHVYDRDRHLRCTIDASHCRAFMVGLGTGLLFAIVGMKLVIPEMTRAVQTSPNLTKTRPANP